MTNEELLDKIMYSQVPTVTILERGEYRAELLRRLGAAVSASPQPQCLTDEEMREIGRKIGSAVNPESEAVRLLGFFAAAPTQSGDRCAKLECGQAKGSWSHEVGSSFYTHEFQPISTKAAQEQPVENSPQKYFCSNCVQYLTEIEAMDTHDQSHDIVRVYHHPSPQKGKP